MMKLVNIENVVEDVAHTLPCRIEADGPADVKKFFDPYVTEADGAKTATFRGHPLEGTKMELPLGYQAVLVTETKRPLAENADRKLQVAAAIKELTYWNWDKKPSPNDNFVRAMEWTDIAEAIHGD